MMTNNLEGCFEIMIADPIPVDQQIFHSWVNGLSVSEAAIRKQQQEPGLCSNFAMFGDADRVHALLKREIHEQYNVFKCLQGYLDKPPQLLQQTAFHFNYDVAKALYDSYYDFDESFFRELMGKRLAQSFKRELYDISDRLRIRISSCHRQFDNLKRISKAVLEGQSQGPQLERIHRDFMLSKALAAKYQHVIFMCDNKIDVSKRAFNNVSFKDIDHILEKLIPLWCTAWSCDIDATFVEEVRDMKGITGENRFFDELKLCVRDGVNEAYQAKKKMMLSAERVAVFEKNLPYLVKSMLSIASNLSQSRELRDLFIDVVDKLVEPLNKCDLRAEESKLLLRVLESCLPKMRGLSTPYIKTAPLWLKTIKGFRYMTIGLYHVR